MVSMFISSLSFAQDMSGKENYDQAYRQLPDGSSRYVGKCKTHEDYEGKAFLVQKVIQSNIDSDSFNDEIVKSITEQVGILPFRLMMKQFFGDLADTSTTSSMIHDFQEYADDITVDQISLIGSESQTFLRFNVGYGGGNGGYLVLFKTDSGYLKISSTNDGELGYCDLKVWK